MGERGSSGVDDDGQPAGASLSQDTSEGSYVSLTPKPWEPVEKLPPHPESADEVARRQRQAAVDDAFAQEVLSPETSDAHAGGADGGEPAAYRPQMVLATLVSHAPRMRVDRGERRQPVRTAPAPRPRPAKKAKHQYPPLPLTKATLVDLSSPPSRRRVPPVVVAGAAAALPPPPRLEDVPSTQESIDDDSSDPPARRSTYSSIES